MTKFLISHKNSSKKSFHLNIGKIDRAHVSCLVLSRESCFYFCVRPWNTGLSDQRLFCLCSFFSRVLQIVFIELITTTRPGQDSVVSVNHCHHTVALVSSHKTTVQKTPPRYLSSELHEPGCSWWGDAADPWTHHTCLFINDMHCCSCNWT